VIPADALGDPVEVLLELPAEPALADPAAADHVAHAPPAVAYDAAGEGLAAGEAGGASRYSSLPTSTVSVAWSSGPGV